jgi:hypothetical protein
MRLCRHLNAGPASRSHHATARAATILAACFIAFSGSSRRATQASGVFRMAYLKTGVPMMLFLTFTATTTWRSGAFPSHKGASFAPPSTPVNNEVPCCNAYMARRRRYKLKLTLEDFRRRLAVYPPGALREAMRALGKKNGDEERHPLRAATR